MKALMKLASNSLATLFWKMWVIPQLNFKFLDIHSNLEPYYLRKTYLKPSRRISLPVEFSSDAYGILASP